MYSLISQRNNGKKIPPISIYTMFSSDDIPSLLQELKTFVSENNCKDIDLCILFPQAILDEISAGRLKNLSEFLHKIGFKMGIYMIGARYLHNNCFNYRVFDRFVVKSEYIAHAIGSNGNIKYCADTLSVLKKFADILSVPCEITDYEKNLMFNAGFSDFSHANKPVVGFNELINDYRKYTRVKAVDLPKIENTAFEIEPSVAFYDILKSGLVWLFCDVKNQMLKITANANEVFGFNVCEDVLMSDLSSVFSFVHPEDVSIVMEKIAYAKMSLKVVSFETRIVTGPSKTSYGDFCVTLFCAVDTSGKPVRYQVGLSKRA